MNEVIRRFFAYYRPYRGLFILDFSCAIVVAILELSFPIFVNQVVDQLLPGNNWPLIVGACVALLVIYVISTFLQFIVNYWGHMLGINIETEMRRKAFDHLQKLSFGFFDNQKTGHLVARLTKDLEEIGEVAHHGPEDLFIAVMTLVRLMKRRRDQLVADVQRQVDAHRKRPKQSSDDETRKAA